MRALREHGDEVRPLRPLEPLESFPHISNGLTAIYIPLRGRVDLENNLDLVPLFNLIGPKELWLGPDAYERYQASHGSTQYLGYKIDLSNEIPENTLVIRMNLHPEGWPGETI